MLRKLEFSQHIFKIILKYQIQRKSIQRELSSHVDWVTDRKDSTPIVTFAIFVIGLRIFWRK
jgi:hypothetical protein